MQSKADKFSVIYESDAAATAAEAALVASVEKWEDPDFKADGSSLYKDPFHPPHGKAVAASVCLEPQSSPLEGSLRPCQSAAATSFFCD